MKHALPFGVATPAKRPAPARSVAAVASVARQQPPLLALAEGQLMHSTSTKSAGLRKWLALTPTAQERDPTLSYCSSDGSSTGWHSCVFVPRSGVVGAEPLARLRVRWGDMKGSRNVGAEASGFLLSMQTVAAAPPADTRNVVFLADFLNALAWDVGAANYCHEVMTAVYGEVETLRRTAGVGKHAHPDGGRWDHVHHPGHQKDASWYTQLNLAADNLASLGMDVDCYVPLSVLRSLMTTQGKDAAAACKAAVEGAAAVSSSGASSSPRPN